MRLVFKVIFLNYTQKLITYTNHLEFRHNENFWLFMVMTMLRRYCILIYFDIHSVGTNPLWLPERHNHVNCNFWAKSVINPVIYDHNL